MMPTSAGRERQRHTAGLHIHAPPRSTTSRIRQTSYLHHSYNKIESATGLCTAVLTSKEDYTPHQAAQLHRGIVHRGLTKSISQSDAETSSMQLVNTVSTDLKLPTRVSPPCSHQSQGKVERFHRNFFDQLGTTRLQWSKHLKS